MTHTYPTPQHETLAAIAGHWTGTTRVWFEPTSEPLEDPVTATAAVAAGGHAVTLSYAGTVGEDKTDGYMLIGFNPAHNRHSVAWVDSFHSSVMMVSTGTATPDALLDVTGTWEYEGASFEWITRISLEGPNRLVIRMYNVMPGIDPYMGVETVLNRATGRT